MYASKSKLIAVMGRTGTGKSTFINRASDCNLKVGHGLESETIEIQQARTYMGDDEVILVDTPGFDDTERSQADILKLIGEFLQQTYAGNRLLDGILFLHDIAANRMDGARLRSYKLFRAICGDEAMKRVIIVTTMWEAVPPEAGAARLKDLQVEFFKDALDKGAQIVRHHDTKESAIGILRQLVGERAEPNALDIQREMVDKNRRVAETVAGKVLMGQLGAEIARLEKEASEKEHEELGLEGKLAEHVGCDLVDRTGTEREDEISQIRQAIVKVKTERAKLLKALDETLSAHLKEIIAQITRVDNTAREQAMDEGDKGLSSRHPVSSINPSTPSTSVSTQSVKPAHPDADDSTPELPETKSAPSSTHLPAVSVPVPSHHVTTPDSSPPPTCANTAMDTLSDPSGDPMQDDILSHPPSYTPVQVAPSPSASKPTHSRAPTPVSQRDALQRAERATSQISSTDGSSGRASAETRSPNAKPTEYTATTPAKAPLPNTPDLVPPSTALNKQPKPMPPSPTSSSKEEKQQRRPPSHTQQLQPDNPSTSSATPGCKCCVIM